MIPAHRFAYAVSQGHRLGKCRIIFRAEVATRAGTLMSLARIVPVLAADSPAPARVAAALVELKAMTARTSQAALVLNFPGGKCARALSLRPALTFSMIA